MLEVVLYLATLGCSGISPLKLIEDNLSSFGWVDGYQNKVVPRALPSSLRGGSVF